MRTRHWLAAFTSGCMALAGVGTATAQPPGMPTNGNPDQQNFGMLPVPYNTMYGPMQPGSYPMNQPGYPPGTNQWPNVSPFAGPPVNSTTYENGFWYNLTRQGSRQYYFSAEALFGQASKGTTTIIGAPNVNPLTIETQNGLNVPSTASTTTGTTTSTTTSTTTATSTSVTGTTQFNQSPTGTGPVISASSSGSTGSTGTTGTTGSTGGSGGTGTSGTVGTVIFPSENTGVLTNNPFSNGFRATWGWFNNDDTGFVASGFATSQTTANWDLVDPYLILDPNNRNNNALLHLHAWFGLPLAGADTDNTSVNGVINDGAVIPFDMGVRVSFQSRLAGGNADWYFNPIYEQGKVKIRPTAGVKYVRLQEDFGFDGYDSGMGYTVSAGGSGSSGSTSGGSTSGSTSGTSSGTGFLTPSSFQSGFNTPNVIHSHLTSTVLSDMAGPEVGFRIDLGGKKFQLWTQTKGGLLADVSQRNLNGFGIGNAFNITTVNNIVNTVPVMPNNPSLTSFNNSQTTTTMSPMFEQQINVKIPVFNLIPYLNKMELFERAQLTGGYTFLFLGDVYRPQNTIVWNQYPNTPGFNGSKSNYYNNMFNVGIEWTY